MKIKTCQRKGCNDLQDKTSPLFLCRAHQSMVDSKRLGYIEDRNGNRNPPSLEDLGIG